jgi:PspAA-like protein
VIVRILGEGQLSVDDAETAALNELDNKLSSAIDAGDEAVFRRALNELLAQVRAVGKAVPADSLEPSELILPPEDASLAEVRQMMTGEGLIPG